MAVATNLLNCVAGTTLRFRPRTVNFAGGPPRSQTGGSDDLRLRAPGSLRHRARGLVRPGGPGGARGPRDDAEVGIASQREGGTFVLLETTFQASPCFATMSVMNPAVGCPAAIVPPLNSQRPSTTTTSGETT